MFFLNSSTIFFEFHTAHRVVDHFLIKAEGKVFVDDPHHQFIQSKLIDEIIGKEDHRVHPVFKVRLFAASSLRAARRMSSG